MTSQRQVKRVRKAHLKYTGLQSATLKRYQTHVRKFFGYLDFEHLDTPSSLEDLDIAAAEYINFLYQDDRPYGWAADFLSGLKRMYPKARRRLDTSSVWLKNWSRTLRPTRALPLPCDLVQAMACSALLRGELQFGTALLLGFLCFLRVGEIVNLQSKDIRFFCNPVLAFLTLEDSKGAKRSGAAEHVVLKDAAVVSLLRLLCKGKASPALLFPIKWTAFCESLQVAGARFGLSSTRLTPHCLRRGGATWYFLASGSYDKTQHRGRWQCAKTARQYIDESVSDMASVSLSTADKRRVVRAVQALPAAIDRLVSR